MHQGNFIRAHLKERRYHLYELSELSGIPEDELNDLLKLEVLPSEALVKIAWVWPMPPEQFFTLPGDGQTFG
jgi:hypothetical protein